MAMTRKDYECIAVAINATRIAEIARHHNNLEAVNNVAMQLAATFSLTNDSFKADVFLKACMETDNGP